MAMLLFTRRAGYGAVAYSAALHHRHVSCLFASEFKLEVSCLGDSMYPSTLQKYVITRVVPRLEDY